MGEAAGVRAFRLASLLRERGISAQCDLMGRSLKAQMKYANKLKARYVVVIGEDELQRGEGLLKSMDTGETTPVRLDEGIQIP